MSRSLLSVAGLGLDTQTNAQRENESSENINNL
jgi:hypothetical protein